MTKFSNHKIKENCIAAKFQIQLLSFLGRLTYILTDPQRHWVFLNPLFRDLATPLNYIYIYKCALSHLHEFYQFPFPLDFKINI